MSAELRVVLALLRLVVGEADATERESARDAAAIVVMGEVVEDDQKEAA